MTAGVIHGGELSIRRSKEQLFLTLAETMRT